jgi:Cdc6-like AAA superfamily ATPase
MADHRDDLTIILAGYPDRIDALLETNPGFKSRFAERLVFEDYSAEQLKSILKVMAPSSVTRSKQSPLTRPSTCLRASASGSTSETRARLGTCLNRLFGVRRHVSTSCVALARL